MFIQFSIEGLRNVENAVLNSHLNQRDDQNTGTFDLNSLTDLGVTIDTTDWNRHVIGTVEDDWFDNETPNGTTLTSNVTSLWNDHFNDDNTYIAFKIQLDNEEDYDPAVDDDVRRGICTLGSFSGFCTSAGFGNGSFIDYNYYR